jgi:hypothetical protein
MWKGERMKSLIGGEKYEREILARRRFKAGRLVEAKKDGRRKK